MNIQIKSASGGPDHQVDFRDGVWSCDCKGYYYRRRCRHITEAQAQIEFPHPVIWDRRWFWGVRDGKSVFWQMLFGIGGPVTIFDGEISQLVAWDDVDIESVKWAGDLVEADGVESAYFKHLVERT